MEDEKKKKGRQVLFFLLICTAFGSGNLIVLLIAAIVVLYYYLEKRTVTGQRGRIFPKLEAAETGKKNEKIPVRYVITTENGIAAAGVQAEFQFTNLYTTEQTTVPFKVSLIPYRGAACAMNLTETRCGVVRICVRNAKLSDFLGSSMRELPDLEEKKVLIEPGAVNVTLPEVFREREMRARRTTEEAVPHGADEPAAPVHSGGPSAASEHSAADSAAANVPVTIRGAVVLFDNALPEGVMIPPDVKSRLADRLFGLSEALLRADIPHTLMWAGSGGALERAEVRSEEQRRAAMRSILSCGFRPDGDSVGERFRAAMGAGIGNVDYVTVSWREKADEMTA